MAECKGCKGTGDCQNCKGKGQVYEGILATQHKCKRCATVGQMHCLQWKW